MLRSEIPSGICAKLRTVAASNNRVHMPWSLCYIACSRHIYVWCCSSRTSRSWWITRLTQHHRRGCNTTYQPIWLGPLYKKTEHACADYKQSRNSTQSRNTGQSYLNCCHRQPTHLRMQTQIFFVFDRKIFFVLVSFLGELDCLVLSENQKQPPHVTTQALARGCAGAGANQSETSSCDDPRASSNTTAAKQGT